jgi:hypothetical protein
MARIYQPRRLGDGSGWHYTVASDEEHWCHAVGYCGKTFDALWPERRPDAFPTDDAHYAALRAEALPFRDKYHRTPHATAEEAVACYREFLIDQELRITEDATTQAHCRVCQAWTTGRVTVGHSLSRRFVLCPAHQTRDVIADLVQKGVS